MTSEVEQGVSMAPGASSKAGMLRVVRRAIFWISLPFGILSFVLPIYGKEIGAGALQIGLFFSVFFLMAVLLRPVVGAGLDRFGRRPFFIAGLVTYALTMFVFAASDQIWGIYLARILQGVASAFLWLAAQAITADIAGDDNRGRAFGRVDQSANQGAILGTFIGFTVLAVVNFGRGWQVLFTGYGIVGLITAALAWRSLDETNPAAHVKEQRPIQWSRPWMLLLLVTVVTAAAWAMVSPILMIFLQDKLDAGVAALAIAYLPAAMVGATLSARLGGLADRFGRKPLMVAGLAMAALTSFLIPGLTSLAALAVLWALQALFYTAGDPAEQALVADLTGGDQRGRAYGFYAMAGGLGASAGPVLGGWLYQTINPAAPFIANGIILAICAMALAALLQLPPKDK